MMRFELCRRTPRQRRDGAICGGVVALISSCCWNLGKVERGAGIEVEMLLVITSWILSHIQNVLLSARVLLR